MTFQGHIQPFIELMACLERHGSYFGLERSRAEEEAAAMIGTLAGWRDLATSKEVGLTEPELEQFEPAFAR